MRKNIFISLATVCLLALTLCFTSCNESVESQIFDLSFDDSAVEQGEIMIYQLTYEPIFIEELGKVAAPVTVGSRTFMVNTTEKKAKADVKAAFDTAAKKAQDKAGEPSSIKGMKVILQYSNGSHPQPVDFTDYTFK